MIAKVFHQFTVPGNPIPWARSGHAGNRHFTPKRQKDYAAVVIAHARAARVPRLDGPVALVVRAWWSCPKALQRVREPYMGGPKTSKPDADNVAKLFLDALNGLAYADDAQVVELLVYKNWAPQSEPGRVTVRYWELNE